MQHDNLHPCSVRVPDSSKQVFFLLSFLPNVDSQSMLVIQGAPGNVPYDTDKMGVRTKVLGTPHLI